MPAKKPVPKLNPQILSAAYEYATNNFERRLLEGNYWLKNEQKRTHVENCLSPVNYFDLLKRLDKPKQAVKNPLSFAEWNNMDMLQSFYLAMDVQNFALNNIPFKEVVKGYILNFSGNFLYLVNCQKELEKVEDTLHKFKVNSDLYNQDHLSEYVDDFEQRAITNSCMQRIYDVSLHLPGYAMSARLQR